MTVLEGFNQGLYRQDNRFLTSYDLVENLHGKLRVLGLNCTYHREVQIEAPI